MRYEKTELTKLQGMMDTLRAENAALRSELAALKGTTPAPSHGGDEDLREALEWADSHIHCATTIARAYRSKCTEVEELARLHKTIIGIRNEELSKTRAALEAHEKQEVAYLDTISSLEQKLDGAMMAEDAAEWHKNLERIDHLKKALDEAFKLLEEWRKCRCEPEGTECDRCKAIARIRGMM